MASGAPGTAILGGLMWQVTLILNLLLPLHEKSHLGAYVSSTLFIGPFNKD